MVCLKPVGNKGFEIPEKDNSEMLFLGAKVCVIVGMPASNPCLMDLGMKL